MSSPRDTRRKSFSDDDLNEHKLSVDFREDAEVSAINENAVLRLREEIEALTIDNAKLRQQYEELLIAYNLLLASAAYPKVALPTPAAMPHLTINPQAPISVDAPLGSSHITISPLVTTPISTDVPPLETSLIVSSSPLFPPIKSAASSTAMGDHFLKPPAKRPSPVSVRKSSGSGYAHTSIPEEHKPKQHPRTHKDRHLPSVFQTKRTFDKKATDKSKKPPGRTPAANIGRFTPGGNIEY